MVFHHRYRRLAGWGVLVLIVAAFVSFMAQDSSWRPAAPTGFETPMGIPVGESVANSLSGDLFQQFHHEKTVAPIEHQPDPF